MNFKLQCTETNLLCNYNFHGHVKYLVYRSTRKHFIKCSQMRNVRFQLKDTACFPSKAFAVHLKG